jgi:hypothetical protein
MLMLSSGIHWLLQMVLCVEWLLLGLSGLMLMLSTDTFVVENAGRDLYLVEPNIR